MSVNKQRMMRQVVDRMWKKFRAGGMRRHMLVRILEVIDMPKPKEWRGS
jgi:hypothetical protein